MIGPPDDKEVENVSAKRGTIYIVDDDKIILHSLTELLRAAGYEVEGGVTFDETVQALSRRPHDILITDMNLPDTDGFELLRVVKKRYPELIVIVITGYGTIESAVEAMKMGAYDYLTKPIMDDELHMVVERAMEQRLLLCENRTLRDQLDERYSLDRLVGHDYKMLRIFDLVETVAESKVNVLVLGASGTGKSLVARVIHHRSPRRDNPFIEVSCGAIPESLLESELFGHARGAFTGAVADKAGKFKAADGGTLFLDEIAAASPGLQVKLLRAIQEREFEPIGSNKTEKVDVRLIFATNVELEDEVAAGRFRQDLYYRINVVTVCLPTLAERIGDIPRLAEMFLKRYRAETNRSGLCAQSFADEAMQCMQRYHWPGNVRELENVVERAVVLTKGRHITVNDLPAKLVEVSSSAPTGEQYAPMPLKTALEDPERKLIETALRHNDWCRQATAEALQINRTTLYKKMKRYGLEADPALRVSSR